MGKVSTHRYELISQYSFNVQKYMNITIPNQYQYLRAVNIHVLEVWLLDAYQRHKGLTSGCDSHTTHRAPRRRLTLFSGDPRHKGIGHGSRARVTPASSPRPTPSRVAEQPAAAATRARTGRARRTRTTRSPARAPPGALSTRGSLPTPPTARTR
jgi:hypothetical protein